MSLIGPVREVKPSRLPATAAAAAAAATPATTASAIAATAGAATAASAVAATAASGPSAAAAATLGLGFVDGDRPAAEILLILLGDGSFELIGIDVDEAKASPLDDAGVAGAVGAEMSLEIALAHAIGQIADVKCFCCHEGLLLAGIPAISQQIGNARTRNESGLMAELYGAKKAVSRACRGDSTI